MAQLGCDGSLVGRMPVGVQEADGDCLGVSQIGERGEVEGSELACRPHPSADARTPFERNERRRVLSAETVEMRAVLPAQVEQMLEPLGRDERGSRAAPLEERVRGDRRAVPGPLDRARLGTDCGGGRQDRVCLPPRRRHLGDPQLAVAEKHRVGKGASDIDAENAHGATVSRGGVTTIARVKVLLVTLYFPPAGGGGVQRPLKLAQYLPALGIETHVLAPDDPRWIHRDEGQRVPTQAWVHRARYLGPRGRKPAEELHGKTGLPLLATQARLASRRLLVPDENVSWNLTAIPAAVRIARREGIDVVITTSPPNSVHFVGAAVQRATGARWLADLRDSLVAHPHRRAESAAVRAKEKIDDAVARLVARRADAVSCVSDAIADEIRTRSPRGPVVKIANGCDFDDTAGLSYTPSQRFRITHAGSFFGKRDPKPFMQALADSGLDLVARFLGDFRSVDREWAEKLGLGDRLELIPYAPRATSLALQRDSEALLLLIPDAGGRGKGVLSGKVFEYVAVGRPILAAVPPDGAAAALIRDTGAGVVVPPDDVTALRHALEELHARFADGGLPDVVLDEDVRQQLSRRTRVEETAALLRSLAYD